MVNTLRITSVVVVVIAGVLLVLVVGPKSLLPGLLAKFALGNDEEVARILASPSVVDLFQKDHGSRDPSREDATPPLVKQAELFAGIINPPDSDAAPPRTRTQSGGQRASVVAPAQTSAKFTLEGTSYLASDPEASFAYIRLQDDTQQWVRKGDEIGHAEVKEIRNGSIIYWDGQNDVEMTVEGMHDTAGLLETGHAAAVQPEAEAVPAVPSASGRITGPPVARPWLPSRGAARSSLKIDRQEREKMDELVNRIRESKDAHPGESPEDRAARVRKMMSELKSSRVSAEEAENVEDLGRELNESQKAPPSPKRTNLRRKLNIPGSPKK